MVGQVVPVQFLGTPLIERHVSVCDGSSGCCGVFPPRCHPCRETADRLARRPCQYERPQLTKMAAMTSATSLASIGEVRPLPRQADRGVLRNRFRRPLREKMWVAPGSSPGATSPAIWLVPFDRRPPLVTAVRATRVLATRGTVACGMTAAVRGKGNLFRMSLGRKGLMEPPRCAARAGRA